jgi:hypothetical protein
MAPRTLALLLAGFAGGFVAGCSPTAPTCSSTTCGGCCDSLGKCQQGTTAEACGINGATCGRCGMGTVCGSGECRVSGTGGGGATGGGTGTGGGTSTGGGGGSACRTVSVPTQFGNTALAEYRAFSSGNGHYNVVIFIASQSSTEGARFEVVYPGDGPFPLPASGSFVNRGYRQCEVCAIFNEGCTANACARQYLATSGSYTVTRADRAAEGRIAASASNLRFVEWNLTTDTPVTGGGCVQISALGPFEVGWTADGGIVP